MGETLQVTKNFPMQRNDFLHARVVFARHTTQSKVKKIRRHETPGPVRRERRSSELEETSELGVQFF